MAKQLVLWGYHRITGRWDRLQASDKESLLEYQKYFAKTTLRDAYAGVPYSGFSGDTRPVYTKFVISSTRPKVLKNGSAVKPNEWIPAHAVRIRRVGGKTLVDILK